MASSTEDWVKSHQDRIVGLNRNPVSGAANADALSRGVDRAKYFDLAAGGIDHPQYGSLSAGTTLYRFGHSYNRDEDKKGEVVTSNITSPWWISAADFASFLSESTTEDGHFSSYSLNRLVRARLAVTHQYGQADRILKARTRKPFNIFYGRGKNIDYEKTTWSASPYVTQFFIPGLRIDQGGEVRQSPLIDVDFQILQDRPAHEFFLFSS